jgi:desumoylating isopeptidase 1
MSGPPSSSQQQQQQQQPQQQQQYEVQLAIYDLSQGMARQLSGQFLGPEHALDLIPHTGVRVYGKEYYFGGGIQCASNPLQFQASTGLRPIQVQSLGYTTTDRTAFEAWCVQQQQYPHGRFTLTSYDLLHRNCNHFSDEAVLHGLHLSRGVPHWILDVPRRFLASPMGQLIRPILDQMQVTGTSPVVNNNSSSIGAWGNSSGTVPPPLTSNMPNVVVASASTVAYPNPWEAATSSSRATTTTIPITTTTSDVTTKLITTTQPKDTSATPVLDLFHKPLVSKDTRSIPVIIRKLSGISSGQDENQGAATTQALSNLGSLLELSLLSTTTTTSTGACDTKTTTTSSSLSSTTELGSMSSIEAGLTELHRILVVTESSNLAFALMLLRLVVLVVPTKETMSLSSTSSLSPSPMLQIILEWMQDQLVSVGDDDNDAEDSSSCCAIGACDSGGGGSLDQNPAARSMAWCVLSNWVSVIVDYMPPKNSNANQEEPLLMDKQKLIDGAIRDMTASNGQIRQAATCFLYNLALAKTNWTVRFQQQLEQEQQQEQQQNSQGRCSYNSNDDFSENDGILLQDDLLLSILCACVEEFSLLQLLTTSTEVGKEDQYDPTTCLRRLAVIGRILVPVVTTCSNSNNCHTGTTCTVGMTKRHPGQHRCNSAVRQFLLDLGLDQFLKDHVAVVKTAGGADAKKEKDATQCRLLATELYKLL